MEGNTQSLFDRLTSSSLRFGDILFLKLELAVFASFLENDSMDWTKFFQGLWETLVYYNFLWKPLHQAFNESKYLFFLRQYSISW